MTSQDTPHNKRPKPSESIQKDVDVKVDKYIAEITASWQKAVSSILETGRLLIQAKAELPHGKFGTMIEEKLPFGARTAQMLMVIAGHPVLSNAKCISHLPPHWATLHELAQLPEPRLLALIEDGTVHPELEHAEAAALRNEGKSKSKRKRRWDEDEDEDEDSDASVGDLVDEIKEVLDPLRSKIEKVKEEGPAARAAVVDALREHVITVAASWVADLNTTKKETKQKASTDDRAPAAAL